MEAVQFSGYLINTVDADVLAPGHQQPQCWVCLYLFPDNHGLSHCGRVTHIYVSKLNIIGSDNGLLPGQRQAIIWTIARILLIRTLGTNFSENLSEIHTFIFKKMYLKMPSAKLQQFCIGLNVLSFKMTAFSICIGNKANNMTAGFIVIDWVKYPMSRML